MPTDEFRNTFEYGWNPVVVGYFSEDDNLVQDFAPLDMPTFIKGLEDQRRKAEWYKELLSTPITTLSSVPFPGKTADEPVPELTAQMFEDAVEHIRQHGWTQGRDVDTNNGRVCTQGAFGMWVVNRENPYGLATTTHNRERYLAFYHRNLEVSDLMGIDHDLFGSVVAWNDYPDRTETEVIDALTRAAKRLRDLGR